MDARGFSCRRPASDICRGPSVARFRAADRPSSPPVISCRCNSVHDVLEMGLDPAMASTSWLAFFAKSRSRVACCSGSCRSCPACAITTTKSGALAGARGRCVYDRRWIVESKSDDCRHAGVGSIPCLPIIPIFVRPRVTRCRF